MSGGIRRASSRGPRKQRACGRRRQRALDAPSRAQDLLSVRSAWTRGTLARTLLRTAVPPTSDLAQQWSASGAVMLAANEVLGSIASRSDRERLYDCAIRALWTMLPEDHPRTERLILDVDGFNDYPGTHYEDVTAWFERAVAAASTA